jgi:hypothetical protein
MEESFYLGGIHLAIIGKSFQGFKFSRPTITQLREIVLVPTNPNLVSPPFPSFDYYIGG